MTTEMAPFNYFLHSRGPAALPTMHLGWVYTAVLLILLILLTAGLIWAVLYNRKNAGSNVIIPEKRAAFWIYTGAALSTFLLLGMTLYSIITFNAISKPSGAPALTLTVTGYDWWWKVEYDNTDPAFRFVTANEIHIPVGAPVLIKLKSADVIHAFWAPRLAGKTQAIPGVTNEQWLQADSEGIYAGQCTQFCGLQHAHMGFEVIAQQPAEFQKWQDSQRRSASASTLNSPGQKLFVDRCGGCHAIRGTDAAGNHGPDLTHLKSRRLLGAGLLKNSAEHLTKWLIHTQEIKPGARMPSMALTQTELTMLSAYLSTLD